MISHCLGIWLTASAAASANWNALKEVISWPTSVKGVDYVLRCCVKTLAAGMDVYVCTQMGIVFRFDEVFKRLMIWYEILKFYLNSL